MQDQALKSEPFFQSILDTLPMPLFVVDRQFRLIDWNPAANEMIGERAAPAAKRLCGDGLGCLRAEEAELGCGASQDCTECVLRSAITAALNTNSVVRQRTTLRRRIDGRISERHLLVTSLPLTPAGDPLALLLLEDITELDQLRRLVPICSSCKKIRNDQDYWELLEEYLGRTNGMIFTHGLCPDCAKDYFPEDAPDN